MEDVKCYDYYDALLGSMGSNPLKLRGGATAKVICNDTGNDANGGGEINGTVYGSIRGRVYETTQGSSCSQDSRNCYYNSSCEVLGVKNATAQYFECIHYVYYHADNTSDSGSWTGWMEVSDNVLSGSDTTTFDVDELLALGVPGILAFGSANPGESLATNKSHIVTNYGNI